MKRKNPSKSPPRPVDVKNTKEKEAFLLRSSVHVVLILLVGILIYTNSLQAPFQFDEPHFLVKNPVVKNLHYFLRPSQAEELDPNYSFFLKMRYIGYLTFAINYKIHGFHVLGYHLFNLLIHLLNGFCVYFFVLRTFQTPFLRESFLKKDAKFIALFSSLLFVCHPVQTEAVTYIFQRQASLVAFFYLLSLLCYVEGRLSSEAGEASPFRPKLFFAASILSTVFAMKTKENAITLPLIITIYEFFFFTGGIKPRILRLIPWLLSMAIIPITLLQIQGPIRWMMNRVLDSSEMVYREVSREAYLFTQFRVMATYIRLLFLPIHQSFDYEYPLYQSLFEPEVLLAALFHLALLSLAAFLFCRSRAAHRDLRMISFGILWFYVTVSVESSILPLPMVICEYRVYLPAVGWAMAVTAWAWIAAEKLKSRFGGIRKGLFSFLVLVVMLFSVLTYARNMVWRDEVSLWEDVTRKSPRNARGQYNLGFILMRQGRYEEAGGYFQTAFKLNPLDSNASSHLGLIYSRLGRHDDAIKAFETALRLDPKDADAHYNLGTVFQQIRRLEDGAREFQAVLRLNPNDTSSHNNLGVIYGQQGRLDEAIKEFKAALKIDPHHVNAQKNLARISSQ